MFSGSGSPCGSEDDGTSGSGASGEDNVSSKTSQNESEDGSDEMPEPDPAQKKSPDKRPRGRTKASHTPRVGDEEGDVDCGDGKYSEELRNSLVLALTKLREKSQQQDRDYKKEKALREKAEEALSEQETALRRAQKTTEEKVKRLKEEREAALASKNEKFETKRRAFEAELQMLNEQFTGLARELECKKKSSRSLAIPQRLEDMAKQLSERNEIISSLEEALEQFVSEASGLRRERAEQGNVVYELESKISELAGTAGKAKALQKAASNALLDRDTAISMADEHKQLALSLEAELSRLKSQSNPQNNQALIESAKRVTELEASAKVADVSFRNLLGTMKNNLELEKASSHELHTKFKAVESEYLSLREDLNGALNREDSSGTISQKDIEALAAMKQTRDRLSIQAAEQDNIITEIETERDVAQARFRSTTQEKKRIIGFIAHLAGEILDGELMNIKTESMKAKDVENIANCVVTKFREKDDHSSSQGAELVSALERVQQLQISNSALETDFGTAKAKFDDLQKSKLKSESDEFDLAEERIKVLEEELKESSARLSESQQTVDELKRGARENKSLLEEADESKALFRRQLDKAKDALKIEIASSLQLRSDVERLQEENDGAQAQRRRDLQCAADVCDIIESTNSFCGEDAAAYRDFKMDSSGGEFQKLVFMVRKIVDEYELSLSSLEATKVSTRSLEGSANSLQKDFDETKQALKKVSDDVRESQTERDILSEELSAANELLRKQSADRQKEVDAIKSENSNAVLELQAEIDSTNNDLEQISSKLRELLKVKDLLSTELVIVNEKIEEQSMNRQIEILAVKSDGNNFVRELQDEIDKVIGGLKKSNAALLEQCRIGDELTDEVEEVRGSLDRERSERRNEVMAVRSEGENAVLALQESIAEVNEELNRAIFTVKEEGNEKDALIAKLAVAEESFANQTADIQREVSTVKSDGKALVLELQEEIVQISDDLKRSRNICTDLTLQKESLARELCETRQLLEEEIKCRQEGLLAKSSENSQAVFGMQEKVDQANESTKRANDSLSEQRETSESLSEQLKDAKKMLEKTGKSMELSLSNIRTEKEKLSADLDSKRREQESLQNSLELLCRFLDTRKANNARGDVVPSSKNGSRSLPTTTAVTAYNFDNAEEYVSHLRQQLKLRAVEVASIEEAVDEEKMARQNAEKEVEKNIEACERLQALLKTNEVRAERQMMELSETTNRLKSKEAELDNLTQQQLSSPTGETEARQRVEQEVEAVRKKCSRLEAELMEVESQIKELREGAAGLNAKEAELQALALQLTCAVDELEKEKSRIRVLTDESIEQSSQLRFLEREKSLLERKCNDLQDEAGTVRNRLESELEGSTTRHADLERKNLSLTTKCDGLSSELALARETLVGKEQHGHELTSNMKTDNSELRTKITKLTEEIATANESIGMAEDERSMVIYELHNANVQIERIIGHTAKFSSKIKRLENEALGQEENVAISIRESNHLRRQLTELRSQLNSVTAAKGRTEKELLGAHSARGDSAAQLAKEIEFLRAQDEENKLCVLKLIERANGLCAMSKTVAQEKQAENRSAKKLASELQSVSASSRTSEEDNEVLLRGKKKAETELLGTLSKNERLASQLENSQHECEQAVSAAVMLDEKFCKLSEDLSTCRRRIEEYQVQQQEHYENISFRSKERDDLTQQVSNLKRDYATACQETEAARLQVAALSTELAEAREDCEKAVEDRSAVVEELAGINAKQEQDVADYEQDHTALKAATHALEETEERFAHTKVELTACQTEIARIRKKERAATGTVGEALQETKRLEGELFESQESYRQACQAESVAGKKLVAVEAELDEYRQAYEEAVEKEKTNGAKAEKKLAELADKLRRVSADNAKLVGEAQSASARHAAAVADYGEAQATCRRYAQSLEETEAAFAETKTELAACNAALARARSAEQSAAQHTSRSVETTLNARRKLEDDSTITSLQTSLNQSRAAAADLSGRVEDLTEKNGRLEGDLAALTESSTALTESSTALAYQNISLRNSLTHSAAEKDGVEATNADLRKAREELLSRIADLEDALADAPKSATLSADADTAKAREALLFRVADLEDEVEDLVSSQTRRAAAAVAAETKLRDSQEVVARQAAHAVDMARNCRRLEERMGRLAAEEGKIRAALDAIESADVRLELLTPCSTATSSGLFSDKQVRRDERSIAARVAGLQRRGAYAEVGLQSRGCGMTGMSAMITGQMDYLRSCEIDVVELQGEIRMLQAGGLETAGAEMEVEVDVSEAELARREEEALREIMEVLEKEADAKSGAARDEEGLEESTAGNSVAGDWMPVPVSAVPKAQAPKTEAPKPELRKAKAAKVTVPKAVPKAEKARAPAAAPASSSRQGMEKVVNADNSWLNR